MYEIERFVDIVFFCLRQFGLVLNEFPEIFNGVGRSYRRGSYKGILLNDSGLKGALKVVF